MTRSVPETKRSHFESWKLPAELEHWLLELKHRLLELEHWLLELEH
jgi:hypothetical protein